MTSSVLWLDEQTRLSQTLHALGTKSIFFTRPELDAILRVYGRMVAKGEWRDYAIDQTKDMVAFAIFRRTSEMPLFRIEKQPKLARKQGAYAILGAAGQVLRRGADIDLMLRYFAPRTMALID